MIKEEVVTLFGAKTGNCQRVAIALEALGLPYKVERVDLRRGEQRGQEFLRLNPFGRVPLLVDPTFIPPRVSTQSNAILLQLSDSRPGTLLPRIEDPARPISLERFLYFVTDVIAANAGAFLLSQNGHIEGAGLLSLRAIDGIARSERFLVGHAYMGGSSFSLVDIVALTITNAYRDQIPWKDLPLLRRWFDVVMARDDVSRGLAAFDIR